jgi:peroxiredoxin
MVEVGDRAPDVEVMDDQGRTVRLSSLWADRPVVLAFLRHYG